MSSAAGKFEEQCDDEKLEDGTEITQKLEDTTAITPKLEDTIATVRSRILEVEA